MISSYESVKFDDCHRCKNMPETCRGLLEFDRLHGFGCWSGSAVLVAVRAAMKF